MKDDNFIYKYTLLLTFLFFLYFIFPINSENEYLKPLKKPLQVQMKNFFRKVIYILNENEIEYVIFFGTLLGKCRHNDIIPWDDDLDICIQINEIPKLREIRWEKYGLRFIKNRRFFKIYDINNKNIDNRKFSWPFLDLFKYENVNNKNIRIYDVHKNLYISKSDLYPIKNTDFLGIKTNIPNRPKEILDITYEKNWETECVSPDWDHTIEKKKNSKKFKCPKSILNYKC